MRPFEPKLLASLRLDPNSGLILEIQLGSWLVQGAQNWSRKKLIGKDRLSKSFLGDSEIFPYLSAFDTVLTLSPCFWINSGSRIAGNGRSLLALDRYDDRFFEQ